MSYQPLHHKYRPKSFAQLVGQEAIATTLTNAIRTGKIAPAYLFTGPRGTGKTSSARILAKSLNCLNSEKPTAEPCGVCDVCQGITKGYSLDVIEIDAASNTGVDNIRELIEKAQFAPVQCRYKVYVVDECHMLSTAAFNALLKTLEEPPQHVVFILATTDPQRVLPTIISRCQRFDFRRIQLEAMVQHLSHIAVKENISISRDAVTLIAQISQGGLRDAQSLLDQLALVVGEVTPDKVWDLVGSVSEQDLLTLVNAIADHHPESVLYCVRNILDSGREPLIILQNLAACYRDLLIAKTAPNCQDLVTCTQATWKGLLELADKLDVTAILRAQQHLRTAEVQIKNTTQPRLWLEVTLLGLLAGAKTESIAANVITQRVFSPPSQSVHEQITAVNEKPTPPTQTAETAVTYPTSTVIDVTQSDWGEIWQHILEQLPNPGSRALLKQHGRLLNVVDNSAEVGMPPALVKFAQPKSTEVEAALERIYQRKIKVSWIANQSKNASATRNKLTPAADSNAIQPPKALPQPEPIKPAPSNQETVENQVKSPPPTQVLKTRDNDNDEVTIAAQRLAQFFDGQILRNTDDGVEDFEPMNASEWIDDSEVDED